MIVLRPLHVLSVVLAMVFLIKGLWLYLMASVAALFCLGIIGSKLHPFQSAEELAQGPIEGHAARLEAQQLTQQDEHTLIGPACTRVGILIGFFVGVVLWMGFRLHWYFALGIACVVMLFAGAILKLAFRAV